MPKKKKQNKEEIDNTDLTTQDSEDYNINTPNELSIVSLPIKHQRVVHMYLTGGLTIKEIAEIMDYSVQYVRNLLSEKHIKSVIENVQLQEDELIRQSIKALRMKALKKMNDLMDSRQDAIAYQAARDVLDRTGHKGAIKQEVDVKVTFEQQLKEVLKDTNYIEVDYDIQE